MKTEIRITKAEDGTVDVEATEEVLEDANSEAENPVASLLDAVDFEDKRVRITVETDELCYADRFALAIEQYLNQ